MAQEKTADEWQKQIDAHREQNLQWVSNIGAFMTRTSAWMEKTEIQMKHLQGVLETFIQQNTARMEKQDRILEELRAARQNGRATK